MIATAVRVAMVLAFSASLGPARAEPAGGADRCRGTKVLMLGTGSPAADPSRAGPSLAVLADGKIFLFDAGAGVVKRAVAGLRKACPGRRVRDITRVYLTHLHSDHTVGLPDLMLIPWALGRPDPLRIHGPPGTRSMVEHLRAAYRQDIRKRLDSGRPVREAGIRTVVRELTAGEVVEDGRVRVRAFAVAHGNWEHAYGYRIDTPTRSVVISGDTAPTEAVVEACAGCDVLVHEVYARAGARLRDPAWREYLRTHHTASDELARLAKRAHPKLLVLYHQLTLGVPHEQLRDEIRKGYKGRLASARDLDVL